MTDRRYEARLYDEPYDLEDLAWEDRYDDYDIEVVEEVEPYYDVYDEREVTLEDPSPELESDTFPEVETEFCGTVTYEYTLGDLWTTLTNDEGETVDFNLRDILSGEALNQYEALTQVIQACEASFTMRTRAEELDDETSTTFHEGHFDMTYDEQGNVVQIISENFFVREAIDPDSEEILEDMEADSIYEENARPYNFPPLLPTAEDVGQNQIENKYNQDEETGVDDGNVYELITGVSPLPKQNELSPDVQEEPTNRLSYEIMSEYHHDSNSIKLPTQLTKAREGPPNPNLEIAPSSTQKEVMSDTVAEINIPNLDAPQLVSGNKTNKVYLLSEKKEVVKVLTATSNEDRSQEIPIDASDVSGLVCRPDIKQAESDNTVVITEKEVKGENETESSPVSHELLPIEIIQDDDQPPTTTPSDEIVPIPLIDDVATLPALVDQTPAEHPDDTGSGLDASIVASESLTLEPQIQPARFIAIAETRELSQHSYKQSEDKKTPENASNHVTEKEQPQAQEPIHHKNDTILHFEKNQTEPLTSTTLPSSDLDYTSVVEPAEASMIQIRPEIPASLQAERTSTHDTPKPETVITTTYQPLAPNGKEDTDCDIYIDEKNKDGQDSLIEAWARDFGLNTQLAGAGESGNEPFLHISRDERQSVESEPSLVSNLSGLSADDNYSISVDAGKTTLPRRRRVRSMRKRV